MTFRGRTEPGGAAFETEAGLTLLESMELAGIPWPSSCRAGTCRTCIGRLLEGEVTYTVEWPGLIPEEKAQAYVLPCVAVAASDVVVTREG